MDFGVARVCWCKCHRSCSGWTDCFNTSYAVNHPPIGQPLKRLNFDESLVQGYMRAGVRGVVQDLSGKTI